MTSSSTVATIADPYAQALLSIAKAQDLASKFGEDAGAIRDILRGSPDLAAALANPFIAPDAKKSIVQQVFGETIHPYFVNFLKLLVDRKRIALLDEMCARYQALLRELTNTVLAEVTSAIELTDAQRSAVIDRVTSMTGAVRVEIAVSLDSSIIGGVIIKVGSQTIDASLKGQLRRIALSLT